MTTTRLAYGGTDHAGVALRGTPTPPLPPPALLVSYWYWKPFSRERARYNFRDYSLDSGAFSAHHSGAAIDLDDYTAFCQDRLTNDPQCTEVFALDVIGDWKASLRNTEHLWSAGVPAIPTYHVGEPTHVLKQLVRDYPKIALGGAVGMRSAPKLAWAKACFAHIWPHRVHGFGFGSETHIMALPWHSVDATNWETGPARFGAWKSMPGGSIRGGSQPILMEVEWYLRLEQRARARWRRELRQLDPDTDLPNVRLAEIGRGTLAQANTRTSPTTT